MAHTASTEVSSVQYGEYMTIVSLLLSRLFGRRRTVTGKSARHTQYLQQQEQLNLVPEPLSKSMMQVMGIEDMG